MSIKNDVIRVAYETYLADKTPGARLALEKVVRDENESSCDAWLRSVDFDNEHPFSNFLVADRFYLQTVCTIDDEGNVAITEDIPVKVNAYKFASMKVSSEKLKAMESNVKDLCVMLKDFYTTFITHENDNGETVVSIGKAKKLAEKYYIDFGFRGHVTSSNLKAASLNYARVTKSLNMAKKFRLANILAIFETIDNANMVAENKRINSVDNALKVLTENGFDVTATENGFDVTVKE